MSTKEATRLSELSTEQKKSGLAAWLGWLFDGLDIHLYTLVATVFVAQLLQVKEDHPSVGQYSSIIQAAFLVGWALGGAFFGRVGDLMGRSRALVLTILTYACFTGLSFFATEWWHLLIFRFLAALGIGGEWAVGASLLAETWPKRWRPWIAAVLQCAVNCGILLATLAGKLLADQEPRYIFLVGILPALITLWIRHAVPEPEDWQNAREGTKAPGIHALFAPGIRGITWRVLAICAVSLTAHWTFMFWQQKYLLSLPEVAQLDQAQRSGVVASGLMWIMFGSLIGNFVAGALARYLGYKLALFFMMFAYFLSMFVCFYWQWDLVAVKWHFANIGLWQGVFGLFTMCLPPLFPVLIRTTGAGFCYNVGRIFAAIGTVVFSLAPSAKVNNYQEALFYAGFLFVPAALLSLMLPHEKETL